MSALSSFQVKPFFLNDLISAMPQAMPVYTSVSHHTRRRTHTEPDRDFLAPWPQPPDANDLVSEVPNDTTNYRPQIAAIPSKRDAKRKQHMIVQGNLNSSEYQTKTGEKSYFALSRTRPEISNFHLSIITQV